MREPTADHPIESLIPYLPTARPVLAIKRGQLSGSWHEGNTFRPGGFSPITTVEQLARTGDDDLLNMRNVGKAAIYALRKAQQQVLSAPPAVHEPRRGSDVEQWLRRERDRYGQDRSVTEWRVLDDLIDDYRLHADTGVPIDSDDNMGPLNA